jgi:uncharacterized protein (TIGR02300 family)
MATASELDKTKRGTKRVCPECATRFYDLLRESIACPACGVVYTAAHQVVETAAAASPPVAKTGWRSKPYPRPEPVHVKHPTSETPVEAEDEAVDESLQEVEDPASDNDAILEHEADEEEDLSELVDHEDKDPKEH